MVGQKKRSPTPFQLPAGFQPTNLKVDAARLGISINTLRSAMLRQGIPGSQARPGRKPFVLPDGFVPSHLVHDAKRLGVAPGTLSAAMRRQGIRNIQAYRRRSVPPDWAKAAET